MKIQFFHPDRNHTKGHYMGTSTVPIMDQAVFSSLCFPSCVRDVLDDECGGWIDGTIAVIAKAPHSNRYPVMFVMVDGAWN